MEASAIYGLTGPAYNPKTDKGFPTTPTWCQRWTRKVIERKFGQKFAGYMKSSALLTARAFQHSQYALRPGDDDLPGDVWFWMHGHGPDGHVGVRVGPRGIAQNTLRLTKGTDARVILDKSLMGPPDLRVRLR